MAKKMNKARMTPGEAMEAARAMAKGRAAPKPLTGAKPAAPPGKPAPATPPAKPLTAEECGRLRKADYFTAMSLAYARNAHDITRRALGEGDARTDRVLENGGTFTVDVLRAAAPSKDPIEEMLVTQILIASARSARYADLAALQTDVVNTKCIAAAADGAGNLFRRLVATLIDYRNPNRGATVLAKQANVAGQQTVNQAHQQVVNPNFQNEKPSNQKDAAGPTTAVPAESRGAGGAAGGDPAKPPLALPDAGGTEAVGPQRHDARDAVGGGDGGGCGAANGVEVPAPEGSG